jgi:ABC-2 type transporter
MAAFASFAAESKLQVYASCFLFFSILFGGYIISGDAIPKYFIWLYYLDPFQWAYNALILNEVYSGRYENPQAILEANGFVDLRDAVLKGDWIWWGVLFLVIYFLSCTAVTAIGLTYSARRRIGGGSIVGAAPEEVGHGNSSVAGEDSAEATLTRFSFQPVVLTFQNLSYEVKASTSNERLQLLKDISGVFHPGRMCALMGEVRDISCFFCGNLPALINSRVHLSAVNAERGGQDDSDGRHSTSEKHGYCIRVCLP